MTTPFFSIIIPTYNRAYILQRAIESVLNQTYKNFEVIIVDDGSNDLTDELIESFISDSRIQFFKQSNQGVSVARNLGASKAKGVYLIFLDSDDELLPDYLQEVVMTISKNPDVIFVGVSFLAGANVIKNFIPSQTYGHYSYDGLYLAGSFVIKRDLFSKVGGYDPILKYGENTELSFRLIDSQLVREYIDKILVHIHRPDSGRINNSLGNLITSTQHVLLKHPHLINHIKFSYNQVAGVACLRLGQLNEARTFLLKAYLLKPYKVITLMRLIISMFPFLAKLLYKKP